MSLFVARCVCFVFVLVASQIIGSGSEKRTCLRRVQYTVKETYITFFTKDVLKTRDGLFCCTGYNPRFSEAKHYVEVDRDADCEPFCQPTCPGNSTCQPPATCDCEHSSQFQAENVATRRCKCNDGFVAKGSNQCIPVCPDRCYNGHCIGNECTCKAGYKKIALRICVPQCSGCKIYEQCTGPEKCSPKACEMPGYERNVLGECVPHCTDCQNGECTAPEKCTCNEGYGMDNATAKCVALCKNCTDGVCTLPNYCDCNVGFVKVDGGCVVAEKDKIYSLMDGSSSGESSLDESERLEVQVISWPWVMLGVVSGLVGGVIVVVVRYKARKKADMVEDSTTREIGPEPPRESEYEEILGFMGPSGAGATLPYDEPYQNLRPLCAGATQQRGAQRAAQRGARTQRAADAQLHAASTSPASAPQDDELDEDGYLVPQALNASYRKN